MAAEFDHNNAKRVRRIQKVYPEGRGHPNRHGLFKEGEFQLIDVFQVYRDYIKHEDDNINTRVTWFIALNSFLFAAFALLIDGYSVDIAVPQHKANLIPVVSILISIVAISISFMTRISVKAAYRSIHRLRIHWCTHHEPVDSDLKDIPVLPHIVGGGPNNNVALKGRILATWMPVVTIFTWTSILSGSVVLTMRDVFKQNVSASLFFGVGIFLLILVIVGLVLVNLNEADRDAPSALKAPNESVNAKSGHT